MMEGKYVYTKIDDSHPLDFEGLARRFGAYRLEAPGKRGRAAMRAIVSVTDSIVSETPGSSAAFERGTGALVLIDKSAGPFNMRTVLEELDPHHDVSCDLPDGSLDLVGLPRHMLYRLLLGRYRAEGGSEGFATNLTGRLLVFEPGWFDSENSQIHAVEVGVDSSCSITADVRTFTGWERECRHHIRYRKGMSWESYTSYYCGPGDDGLRRVRPGDDKRNTYIQRQVRDDRWAEVSWMAYDNEVRLSKSKAGIIDEIMRWFAGEYGELAPFQLEALDPGGYHHVHAASDTCAYPSLAKVAVCDAVGSGLSRQVAAMVKDAVTEEGIPAGIVEGHPDGAGWPSIVLLRDHSDYPEGTDPYRPSLDVQHMGIGDSKYSSFRRTCCVGEKRMDIGKKGAKNVARMTQMCLRDLQVKQDLKAGMFGRIARSGELFPAVDIAGWSFAKAYPREDADPVGAVLSVTDGTGRFSIEEFDPASYWDEAGRLWARAREDIETFSDRVSSPELFGLIVTPDGASAIYETGWHAMPDMELVHDELANPTTGKRAMSTGKANIAMRYNGMVNYNWFPVGTDGSYAYSGGMRDARGGNLQFGKGPGVPIRYVRALEGRVVPPGSLMALTNVPYVRFRRNGVYPYPFKYLDEWVRYRTEPAGTAPASAAGHRSS